MHALPIKIETRSVYGKPTLYVASVHAAAIERLTGKKTVDKSDLDALQALGFTIVDAYVRRGANLNWKN